MKKLFQVVAKHEPLATVIGLLIVAFALIGHLEEVAL